AGAVLRADAVGRRGLAADHQARYATGRLARGACVPGVRAPRVRAWPVVRVRDATCAEARREPARLRSPLRAARSRRAPVGGALQRHSRRQVTLCHLAEMGYVDLVKEHLPEPGTTQGSLLGPTTARTWQCPFV